MGSFIFSVVMVSLGLAAAAVIFTENINYKENPENQDTKEE